MLLDSSLHAVAECSLHACNTYACNTEQVVRARKLPSRVLSHAAAATMLAAKQKLNISPTVCLQTLAGAHNAHNGVSAMP
jgi:hypothetical protein